eukprot:7948210-Pyramimonas_sp.AAC.1
MPMICVAHCKHGGNETVNGRFGNISVSQHTSRLCRKPDYGLLRLIPARRDSPEENDEHIPRWLRQRKGGEIPPARSYQSPGAAPTGQGLPTQGTWPSACSPSLWEVATTHH